MMMHLNFALVILLCPWFCRAQVNNTSGDPCQTPGRCGEFGVCYQRDSPICSCLPGFEPRINQEWASGNWSSGCVRSSPLNCNNATTTDGFFKVQMIIVTVNEDWRPGSEAQCKTRCRTNCSCLAYGFDGGRGCRLWAGTLNNIQKFPSNSGSNLYIRLANSEIDQKKDSKKIIIIVVVVVFFIASICACVSWKWIAARRGKKKSSQLGKQDPSFLADSSLQDVLSQVNLEELPLFKFETVANATNNFFEDSKLGKGGFGSVYKGELVDGREIAVKRLSQASTQGMQEFMNELVLISKLQHRNLVRLIGCCIENKEKMLIYEYMPNKSLDFYLFDHSQQILDWRKRFNVIQGICRGLLYLHRDSRLKIIHRDLKPSNILLDNDWNARISDFGMARIFGTTQDHVSTLRVVGTYGYMAPEYALEGKFSEKSDVFSFGVLMLEITTGRRNKGFQEDGSLNLLGQVWNFWNEDNVSALIDTRISSSSYRAEVMRCIHIGLLCVQQFARDRPSVSAILSMSSSEISELPKPKLPAFAIKSSDNSDAGTTSTHLSTSSINNVTLTTVDGR
ncbi:G-type lectin S-receptor-like serine/threonine-protein kinase At1g11330 isoform X1 [Salvia miltiorrhiza]|uniref:G-type lectin S-receptor-like serine/threonine-protein kinase At1g11330 isoform X1 n=2 Tax=Salvia miltiorrhiza TaxID=226208 RepID=UPI0025AB8970|nr:G-type lectin S-receptor-like serine/threonine-protein kinase At1g11330 isoform X1 [Salvia miltiorrhiza]